MSAFWRWIAVGGMAAVAAGCGQPQQSAQRPGATAAQETPTEGTGIAWSYDFEAALEQGRDSGKPLMVDMFATWCAPCKLLDENVFSRPDVAEASEDFVTVRVDGDKRRDLMSKLKVNAYPTVLFLMPDGSEIGRSLGAVSHEVMLDEMAKAKQEFARRSG
jgi:thiol:disulfide interchange protein